MSEKILIPILGDQLSIHISSLEAQNPCECVLLMMEVGEETAYVRHHKAKIAYIFSAMRHHAKALEERGWSVDYIAWSDPDNSGSFSGEIVRALERHSIESIRITEAGEWRVMAMIENWEQKFGIPVTICPDHRFVATHQDFADWADGKKQLRMEYFYREMRRKTGLLLDENGKPEGGKWNYDNDNRKPAKGDLAIPQPIRFRPDDITREVLALVSDTFADYPGSLDHFHFAVTHEEAMRQKRMQERFHRRIRTACDDTLDRQVILDDFIRRVGNFPQPPHRIQKQHGKAFRSDGGHVDAASLDIEDIFFFPEDIVP